MNLVEELRRLRSQVLQRGAGKRAFYTWESIKHELPARHRGQILTAWNQTLRRQEVQILADAIEKVIDEQNQH